MRYLSINVRSFTINIDLQYEPIERGFSGDLRSSSLFNSRSPLKWQRSASGGGFIFTRVVLILCESENQGLSNPHTSNDTGYQPNDMLLSCDKEKFMKDHDHL